MHESLANDILEVSGTGRCRSNAMRHNGCRDAGHTSHQSMSTLRRLNLALARDTPELIELNEAKAILLIDLRSLLAAVPTETFSANIFH